MSVGDWLIPISVSVGIFALLQLVVSLIKLRSNGKRGGSLPESGSVLTEMERNALSVTSHEVRYICEALKTQGEAIHELSRAQALMLSKILKGRMR